MDFRRSSSAHQGVPDRHGDEDGRRRTGARQRPAASSYAAEVGSVDGLVSGSTATRSAGSVKAGAAAARSAAAIVGAGAGRARRRCASVFRTGACASSRGKTRREGVGRNRRRFTVGQLAADIGRVAAELLGDCAQGLTGLISVPDEDPLAGPCISSRPTPSKTDTSSGRGE